jgi:hypothetical protein
MRRSDQRKEVVMMSIARTVVSVVSIGLSAATAPQAFGAPSDGGKHASLERSAQQNNPGYAASPTHMGARCRAEVREVWPHNPDIQGGADRVLQYVFNACMVNGGTMP